MLGMEKLTLLIGISAAVKNVNIRNTSRKTETVLSEYAFDMSKFGF